MKKDGRKNEVAACATEAANACLHARELAATVDGSNWENFAKENNPLSNPKHESCNAIESNVLTCGNSIVLGQKKGKLIEPLNYCPRNIIFCKHTNLSLKALQVSNLWMLHVHNEALGSLENIAWQINEFCWPVSSLWMCYHCTLDWSKQALNTLLSGLKHTEGTRGNQLAWNRKERRCWERDRVREGETEGVGGRSQSNQAGWLLHV